MLVTWRSDDVRSGALTVSAEELSTIPLFGSLSDAELRELANWFDVQAASGL
jgi:hypothetical protein